MRRFLVIALLMVGPLSVQGQFATTVLRPSAYYTSAAYSNGTSARSYSGYASVLLGGIDYVVAGYDKMSIENPAWNYEQGTAVIGGMKNFYPFYVKLHYGHIQGTFTLANTPYSYEDQTNIFNSEVQYNWDLLFLGCAYSFTTATGYKNVRSHQASLRVDWWPDPIVGVTVRPLYTSVTDGRSLLALDATITAFPVPSLMVQATGVVGKRAYYFNPDLLTVFNQDETQKNMWGLRAEYNLVGPLTIVGVYQVTDFEGYSITYSTVGAKVHLGL